MKQRFYKRPNGDYFAVETPQIKRGVWHGRVPAIIGMTHTVYDTLIGKGYVMNAEIINRGNVPDDWMEAITLDVSARLPRAGGGLTVTEHATRD